MTAEGKGELPIDRVNRLASELSHALNDYNLNCHALVYPSKKMEFSVGIILDGLGRVANPMVATGRGSYRRFSETTLAEILRSYDDAPAEFRDETREEVIAHWRLAEANVNALRARNGLPAESETVRSEILEHRIEAAKAELIACLEAKHGGDAAAVHNDRLVFVYVSAPVETIEYTGPGFYEVEDAKGRRPMLWIERHDYKTVPGFYYRAESWWKGRMEYTKRLKPAAVRIIGKDDEYAVLHRA